MSIVGLILIAQASAMPAADAAPPDIEIRAHADVRSLKISSQGTAPRSPCRAGRRATDCDRAVGSCRQQNLPQSHHRPSRHRAPDRARAAVSSTVNTAGETVSRLRANDGGLYDVVTDTAGKILRSTKVG